MHNYAVCVMRRNYNLMITIVDTFSNKYEGHLKTRPRSYRYFEERNFKK